MGFNLDDMIGAYKDFARGYLFYARVTAPVAIPQNHPYLVNTTSLPAQNLDRAETNWQGQTYKIATTHTFEDFTISFKSDTAQALRSRFVEWMKLIHDPVSNAHGLPNEYFGRVDLSQLNGAGEPIMSYSLINCWPATIGEISLDYSSKEISTFDVTFAYQYYLANDIFDGSEQANPASV